MWNQKQTKRAKVEQKRRNSLRGGPQKLVLEDEGQREFFRFQNGKIIEYDLTKINGKQVVLTEEENEVIKKMGNKQMAEGDKMSWLDPNKDVSANKEKS